MQAYIPIDDPTQLRLQIQRYTRREQEDAAAYARELDKVAQMRRRVPVDDPSRREVTRELHRQLDRLRHDLDAGYRERRSYRACVLAWLRQALANCDGTE